MQSITSLTLNLQLPNCAVTMYAVQNDRLTRKIQATLVDGDTAWTPPVGAVGMVRFVKPDGTQGFYEVDEDGNTAVTWSGNVATIRLAEQALTVAGDVYCQVNFYNASEERLSTFSWLMKVQKCVVTDDTIISTDYFNILSQEIAEILEIYADLPTPSTSNPLMDGTASAGSTSTYSRGDHRHPTDTSRAPTNHASTATTYGAASTSNYGHVRLSNTTPSMDGTAAVGDSTDVARANHVHPSDTSRVPTTRKINNLDLSQDRTLTASDVGASPTNHASTATTYGKGTSSNYGHVKISDSLTDTTTAATGGVVPSMKAVSDLNGAINNCVTNVKYNGGYLKKTINGTDSNIIEIQDTPTDDSSKLPSSKAVYNIINQTTETIAASNITSGVYVTCKKKGNIVRLDCGIVSTSNPVSFSSGNAIFAVLPTEARPPATVYFPILVRLKNQSLNSAPFYGAVFSNGNVVLNSAGLTDVVQMVFGQTYFV